MLLLRGSITMRRIEVRSSMGVPVVSSTQGICLTDQVAPPSTLLRMPIPSTSPPEKLPSPVATQILVLGPRRFPSVALTCAVTAPTESDGAKSVSGVQMALTSSLVADILVVFQRPPQAKPASTSDLLFGFT